MGSAVSAAYEAVNLTDGNNFASALEQYIIVNIMTTIKQPWTQLSNRSLPMTLKYINNILV